MSKMLAAVLHDFDVLKLEDVDRPVPHAPGTVLVKIKSCGFCQTDYKAIKGVRKDSPVNGTSAPVFRLMSDS